MNEHVVYLTMFWTAWQAIATTATLAVLVASAIVAFVQYKSAMNTERYKQTIEILDRYNHQAADAYRAIIFDNGKPLDDAREKMVNMASDEHYDEKVWTDVRSLLTYFSYAQIAYQRGIIDKEMFLHAFVTQVFFTYYVLEPFREEVRSNRPTWDIRPLAEDAAKYAMAHGMMNMLSDLEHMPFEISELQTRVETGES